jgi:hypothetical protein
VLALEGAPWVVVTALVSVVDDVRANESAFA